VSGRRVGAEHPLTTHHSPCSVEIPNLSAAAHI
jgi:hypothetical protein